MVNHEFVKSIASEVTEGLFEGGPGSGNWGHKGRPGHRGGSSGGGGKGKGSGISAHKITVGKQRIHAKNFYNAMGKLDTSNYRKLSDSNKTQVLNHGIQKFTEMYIPRAQQGRLDAKGLETNRKIGALEGMRRAALSKAKGLKAGSKEWRAAMHVAISLQTKARETSSQIKLNPTPKTSDVSAHRVKWGEFFSMRTGPLSAQSQKQNKEAGKLASKIMRRNLNPANREFVRGVQRTIRNNYPVSRNRLEKLRGMEGGRG